MEIINLAIIFVGRFFIKIFITIFSWAIVIFFGKIPTEKNIKLSSMAILSLLWLVVIIGFVFPFITKFVYGYIPNKTLEKSIAAFLSSAGIFILPAIVGLLAFFMENNRWNKNIFKVLAKGYYYCIVMSISISFMLVCAPIITLKRYLLREHTTNIPLIVKNGRVEEVLFLIHEQIVLKDVEVIIKKPNPFYRFPIIILNKLIKDLLKVYDTRNIMLKGDGFKIYINPTDILIEGKKRNIDYIKICIVNILAFDETYMTWSSIGHGYEDKGLCIYNLFIKGLYSINEAILRLDEMLEKLEKESIDYFEWEVITRQFYVFEIEILKFLDFNVDK